MAARLPRSTDALPVWDARPSSCPLRRSWTYQTVDTQIVASHWPNRAVFLLELTPLCVDMFRRTKLVAACTQAKIGQDPGCMRTSAETHHAPTARAQAQSHVHAGDDRPGPHGTQTPTHDCKRAVSIFASSWSYVCRSPLVRWRMLLCYQLCAANHVCETNIKKSLPRMPSMRSTPAC